MGCPLSVMPRCCGPWEPRRSSTVEGAPGRAPMCTTMWPGSSGELFNSLCFSVCAHRSA